MGDCLCWVAELSTSALNVHRCKHEAAEKHPKRWADRAALPWAMDQVVRRGGVELGGYAVGGFNVI
jgi:hypothetical protein